VNAKVRLSIGRAGQQQTPFGQGFSYHPSRHLGSYSSALLEEQILTFHAAFKEFWDRRLAPVFTAHALARAAATRSPAGASAPAATILAPPTRYATRSDIYIYILIFTAHALARAAATRSLAGASAPAAAMQAPPARFGLYTTLPLLIVYGVRHAKGVVGRVVYCAIVCDRIAIM